MTKFIGFDAGGFGDCLYEHVSAQKYMFHADMPAVAILPESSSGQIKFSKEAAEDRCAIGIPRPADGIAVLNGNIRRVLLPLIWKKLLSKEEREQTWYKTSCAALTASYIKHLLQETELSAEKQDELCIAIPDHLPQSSQEYLLRNLRKQLGTDNINLIWRHAAIAVQCLDEISQHTELLSLFKQKQRKLTVLYAGADAIEIAAFDIVVQKFFGRTFLIPKRSIPAQDDLLIFDGLDIASSYAAELFPDLPADDLTGMWHVLNCCKAPWLSLNNKDPVQFLHNDNKKFLYFNSKWHSWQEHLLPRATPSPAQSALTRKLFKSEVLQHIYQPEQNEQQRGLASGKKSYIRTKSWQDCLARFVADFIQTHDIDDSMLILAGPMLSSDSICKNIADKLFRSYAPFAELTEHKKHLFKNLWRASEDCVARGAALFSVRLKHKHVHEY